MEKLYGENNLKIELYNKISIPDISDKKLKELYNLLKPIVTIKEMKYLLKEYSLSELRDQSFLWNREEDKRDFVDVNNLKPIEDFVCLHTYGDDYLFKPSISEVLSQAPQNVFEQANVFEIIERPYTEDDVFKYPEVFKNGFYLSKVRTYKLERKNN